MKHSSLFEKCRTELHITSSAFLDQVLNELATHRVMKTIRRNNKNVVRIPLSDTILRQTIIIEENSTI